MSSLTPNIGLTKIDRGEPYVSAENNNRDLIDSAIGAVNTTIDDLSQTYRLTGTFNGPTGTVVSLPRSVDAVNEYSVHAASTSRAAAIGDIYITKALDQVTVHCSESNTGDTFEVTINYIGDVSSYGGSMYRRYYVSPSSSITDHANAGTAGSIAYMVAAIGSAPAVLVLPGNKTYTIDSDIDLSGNPDLVVKIEPGAIFDRTTGDEVITFYSPNNCDARLGQKITSKDMLAFANPGLVMADWWGAVGNDSADNTNAIQYCLNAAYDSRSTIQFSGGIFKTGALDYHGQSMLGLPGGTPDYPVYWGSHKTVIKGLPGEDIFHFGDVSSITKEYLHGTVIKDVHCIVDDSTDASASFTNRTRYGVGNAAFACEWSDRSVQPYEPFPLIHGHWENVTINSLSLTHQNNSCGFFTQGMVYGTTFEKCYFGRLDFGWFMDYPVANVTSGDFYSDINNWRDCVFGACKESFQHYNGDHNSMINCTVYSFGDGDCSLRIRSVASSAVTEARKWSFINLYSEGGNDSETEYMTITGTGHHFAHCYLMNDQPGESYPTARQGYIAWSANECVVDGMSRLYVKGGFKPIIKLSGNNNIFNGIDVGDVIYNPWTDYNPIQDTGNGNIVTYNRQDDIDTHRSKKVALTISREASFGIRSCDFLRSNPDAPHANNDDLFIWPNEIYWQGASPQPTITKDASLISGQYLTLASPGSGYFIDVNDRQLLVGYEIPRSHAMLFIRLRNASSSTTQVIEIKANDGATTVGSATLNTTNAWAVYSVPLDFSAANVGEYVSISLQAPSVSQDVDIAWIGIVPMAQWFFGAERSADPPAPKEGQFVIWMSDGTGKGDDGDIMIASTAGGVVNYSTLFDHSAGTSWW